MVNPPVFSSAFKPTRIGLIIVLRTTRDFYGVLLPRGRVYAPAREYVLKIYLNKIRSANYFARNPWPAAPRGAAGARAGILPFKSPHSRNER